MTKVEVIAELHRQKFPRRQGVRITPQGDVVVKLKARQLGMTYEQGKADPLILDRLEIIGLSTTSPE
jgi:hypothetical protein